MDSIYIIKKAMLTEKTTASMGEANTYTFAVDRRASKDDIRRAIEELYGVTVDRVRTSILKGAARRLKHGWTTSGDKKKAMVRLVQGQVIELF